MHWARGIPPLTKPRPRAPFALIELLACPAAAPSCGEGRRQTRAAFTLIELLVVIAIMAILMAMLLPSLGRARVQVKKSVCATHLRQLAMASTMYLQDYGNYPTPAYWPASGPLGLDDAATIRGGKIHPHDLHFYNFRQLDPYIERDARTFSAMPPPAGELPAIGICPLFTPTLNSPNDWYSTGFGYYGRLDESQSAVPPAFSDRFARKGCSPSAVLWADTVSYYNWWGSSLWIYNHVLPAGASMYQPTTAFLEDQNRAHVDGSVDRRRAAEIGAATSGAGAGLVFGPYWWWY